eukprot:comp21140_c0_seq1/m.28596 comp21140_c0_seq1/g.28596  ORF comp21140_c0_seq1/g.28596 comp21140_c0_seq1/m.28596 type:complete len:140 (-) comp21140_c0_seq1:492-911(-)
MTTHWAQRFFQAFTDNATNITAAVALFGTFGATLHYVEANRQRTAVLEEKISKTQAVFEVKEVALKEKISNTQAVFEVELRSKEKEMAAQRELFEHKLEIQEQKHQREVEAFKAFTWDVLVKTGLSADYPFQPHPKAGQ